LLLNQQLSVVNRDGAASSAMRSLLGVSSSHPAIRAGRLGSTQEALGSGCIDLGEADAEFDFQGVAAVVTMSKRDGAGDGDLLEIQTQLARLEIEGAAKGGSVGHGQELLRIGPAARTVQLGWKSELERLAIESPCLSLAAAFDLRDRDIEGFQTVLLLRRAMKSANMPPRSVSA